MLNKDSSYNTSYLLDDKDIEIASKLEFEKRGLSNHRVILAGNWSVYSLDDIKAHFLQATINETAQDGQPSFITFSDGSHHILIACLYDETKADKVSYVYVNSVVESQLIKTLADDLDPNDADYDVKLASLQENEIYISQLSYNENIKKVLSTGKVLADCLGATDLSINIQFDNCCGLSVAHNIGVIADLVSKNQPVTKDALLKQSEQLLEDLKKYYQEMGKKLHHKMYGINKAPNPVVAPESTPTIPIQPLPTVTVTTTTPPKITPTVTVPKVPAPVVHTPRLVAPKEPYEKIFQSRFGLTSQVLLERIINLSADNIPLFQSNIESILDKGTWSKSQNTLEATIGIFKKYVNEKSRMSIFGRMIQSIKYYLGFNNIYTTCVTEVDKALKEGYEIVISPQVTSDVNESLRKRASAAAIPLEK